MEIFGCLFGDVAWLLETSQKKIGLEQDMEIF